MDQQVLATQRWLNTTYASAVGWVPLVEDGLTGWEVIYGLRRGLQWELGISPVASGFGDATRAAFISQIGRIDASSSVPPNVLRLLSGALWCKGWQGFLTNQAIDFSIIADSVGNVRFVLGLGGTDPYVDVKLMASLMSMDSYSVLQAGSASVRMVQQWLNKTYSARRDFALVPVDGIFSRQVQTAQFFALQYEFGMADGTANGNYGPGTRDGLRTQAPVGPGSVDGARHFVQLLQGAMRFNGYPMSFNGTFDAETQDQVTAFQTFMEIPVTGRGDFSTWAALLVSSGDTSIATKGFDTNRQLTAAQAAAARTAGYTHVGRYTVGAGKFLTAPELDGLRTAGLKLFPLHQRFNDNAATMTRAAGRTQALEAIERCRVLGLPADSTVFFAVDFDPVGETIYGPVDDFFRGVRDVMDSTLNGSYRVGVYGTRNVCQVMLDQGRADAAFVAGMSTGYSGNMGFPMPKSWQYNQIVEVSETLAGTAVPVDRVVVSSRAAAVDLARVVSPPVERDGSTTATGFDVVFEWVCRAEVACERAIKEADSLLFPITAWKVAIGDHILHWLRKPEYWEESASEMWAAYTPAIGLDKYASAARAASEGALAALSPTKPSSTRDVAHFAATVLGYRTWGVPTTTTAYGLGDLGGWPLDLLQAWGVYDKLTTKPDLLTWMTSNIGQVDSSGFGFKDVVADADAWLLAKALAADSSPTLSGALRSLLSQTTAQRIRRFYAERFASSETNVAAMFTALVDGIDVGPVNFPFTVDVLRRAAVAVRLPSAAEAATCGRAYAQVLARLGA